LNNYHKISVEIPGVGSLSLLADALDAALCFVKFGNCAGGKIKSTPLLQDAEEQLLQYFAGRLTRFQLPVKYNGTPFQETIWHILTKIPCGKLVSYKQLAAAAGHSNAFRAAGMANNKNPLPIVIPCHRVVNHNGKPGGYASGTELKQKLLSIEGIEMVNGKFPASDFYGL